MAKKKRLTELQEEFKKELVNFGKRLKSARRAGYLNERLEEIVPEKITDEYIREHATTRAVERLRSYTTNKIRTPKAKELYEETRLNQLEPEIPETPEPIVRREEIINDFLDDLFTKLDDAQYNNPFNDKQLKPVSEARRSSNVGRIRNLLQNAIAHYGEEQMNKFLSDPNNMQEINTLIDKIAVLYSRNDQAEADALVVEFANMLNAGPLTTEQMQSLEESGAFNFYEDDLI